MSKYKKIADHRAKEKAAIAAERSRMEQFVILDHQGCGTIEKYAAWIAKVKAMTTAELVKEYHRRDGDYVHEHGVHPGHRESHE